MSKLSEDAKFKEILFEELSNAVDNEGPSFLLKTNEEIAEDLLEFSSSFEHCERSDVLPGIAEWRTWKAFEEVALEKGWDITKKSDGRWNDLTIQGAWMGFQAAFQKMRS